MKMSLEYMVKLHKMLHSENTLSDEEWKNAAKEHLKYIPNKKLYRYRKFEERELLTLERNAVWLADPYGFMDVFDATMPLKGMDYFYSEFMLFLSFEISYKALEKMFEEDGEPIPDKEEYLQAMYSTLAKYESLEEMDSRLLEILGEEEYRKVKEYPIDVPKIVERITMTKEFLSDMVDAPRNSLAIASFTTRSDNRNMWENYAQNYSGFCVEYDFSEVLKTSDMKKVKDILRFLPVSYYRELPTFDYTDILRGIIKKSVDSSSFEMDVDDFLSQFYCAITAKLNDYKMEQEWRLVMERDCLGEYVFPYAKRIYLGMNMKEDNVEKVKEIAQKLGVQVYIQTVNARKTGFEYRFVQ